MANNIQYTIDSLPNNNIYFADGTDVQEMLGFISKTHSPITVYEETGFNNLLIIDRTGDDIKFLMNTMPHTDRKKISDLADHFINRFVDDGIWLFDLEHEKVIYNYQTKEHYGKWGVLSREPFGHYIALAGKEVKPIKIYNSGNKMSLYWGFYYVNRYFLNPSGATSEDFGVEVALEFGQKVFNLETYTITFHEKSNIFPKVQVWEQDSPSVPEGSLKKLHKIHSEIYKEERELAEKKEEDVVELFGLTLSDNGKIYMADLVNSKIPELFYPVEIDLDIDPRITGAFVQEGKIFFVSSVSLEDRAKKELKKIMGANGTNTEIKCTHEVDNLLSIGEQFEWYDKFSPTGKIH